MENVACFRQGMKTKYHASEVAEARWIKPRNEQHTAWLITFNKESLPEAVDIPGEQTITEVYPYKDIPMLSRKCQQYSNSIKYSTSEEWTCGKGGEGHPTGECLDMRLQCLHCGGNHQTGH